MRSGALRHACGCISIAASPVSREGSSVSPSTLPLRVAVMGAGAVGCYFGGMLARAGHAVTLIARPAHVEAIRRAGLRMETRSFDEQVKLHADTGAQAARGADVVLFSVKSADTEEAGRQLKPFLRDDALVVCLQNGVDNADRLRAVLPGHAVAAAVVYVATEMAGPGHLKHHGRGELVMEHLPGSDILAQALVAAGVPTELSPDVRGALWMKLILNSACNAISAIARKPYGDCVRSEGVWNVMRDVVDECMAVAQAEGVRLPGDPHTFMHKVVESMPTQFSSTAQDLMRGKPTEIDYLNGFVVRRGEALGIATPANRVLWALVKLIEAK
jgi:2-dehydropantoate 2-reductase